MKLTHATRIAALLLIAHSTVANAQTASPADTADVSRDVATAVERDRLRLKAIDLLVAASVSEQPALRANTIEAMQMVPDRCLPITQRGLGDPNPGVRFAAVVTAAQMDYKNLAPAIRPLMTDVNPSVRAAARYAMHSLGQKVDLTPLAGYLRHDDPSVRANTALLLGLIGEPSAIPLLKQASLVPMPRRSADVVSVVRCQFAEAMVKLGSDSELNTIRASVHGSNGEVRVIAINAIGAVGDEKGAAVLQTVLAPRTATQQPEPAEVRLAAAASIARVARKGRFREKGLGEWLLRVENRAREVVLQFAGQELAVLRAQAAFAMGWFDDPQTLATLVRLMEDANPNVQVYAATAVVRRTSGQFVAEAQGGGASN